MTWIKQLHKSVRDGYRSLAPSCMRGSMLANALKRTLYRFLPKDVIYDQDYFERVVDETSRQAAPVIARSISRDFAPARLLDVGCGSGAMLAALRNEGVVVVGVDGADAALALCRKRGLEVHKVDLRQPETGCLAGQTFDVVISMEVAEHLPETSAVGYVDMLVRFAPVVVFTAAPMGQGGTDHVNEQPMTYWIELFAERGFSPDDVRTQAWRKEWMDSRHVAGWYAHNLMIFQRDDGRIHA